MTPFQIQRRQNGEGDVWLLSTIESQELYLLLGQLQTKSMTNQRLYRALDFPGMSRSWLRV